jgi:hypothetical protein
MQVPAVACVQAAGDALVRLGELVAVHRIVHEVGEVRIQVQLVAMT